MRRETSPPLFAIAWQSRLSGERYFVVNDGPRDDVHSVSDPRDARNARKFSTVADAAEWIASRGNTECPALHVVGLLPGWDGGGVYEQEAAPAVTQQAPSALGQPSVASVDPNPPFPPQLGNLPILAPPIQRVSKTSPEGARFGLGQYGYTKYGTPSSAPAGPMGNGRGCGPGGCCPNG
jgi:hypothetical protein